MFTYETLENGITLATDKIDYVKSATLGIWVKAGSIYESNMQNGISHFIEHMSFKGTEKRSALKLANDLDDIGGQANAFTAKEMTCYYIKVLDSHCLKALEILSDMVLNPRFSKEDIENEKNVVLEEIAMTNDSPDETAVENLINSVWSPSPFCFPILGNEQTVKGFERQKLFEYKNSRYTCDNIVISISGSFDKKQIKAFIEATFKKSQSSPLSIPEPIYRKSIQLLKRDFEQTHIAIGFKSIGTDDSEKNASLSVLNCILGAGMSSRLFQSIREKRGLVYTVSSFPEKHRKNGLFFIYAALKASSQLEAIKLIKQEAINLIDNGLIDGELQRAKEQLKSGVVLGVESTSSRSGYMGRSLCINGKIKPIEQLLNEIDAVNEKQVLELGKEILDFKNSSLCIVGSPTDEDKLSQTLYN